MKGASQHIQVLRQGKLGEEKNSRNKGLSDSFIYLFVQ